MQSPLVATYRVQLQPGFGFADAASIVDYLSDLGISHLYCSPCLQAVRGSTHGYDVVDPTRISSELGGASGFSQLCSTLQGANMSLVLDIVPNHMAIGSRENVWWWDVLENGPAGLYASHFDVDWDPPEVRFRNLILLPVLGDRYGRVLESGVIKLVREERSFILRYHEHLFPVAPRSLNGLLGAACARVESEELAFIAEAFGRLPKPTQTDGPNLQRRHRDKVVLCDMLWRLFSARPDVTAAVDDVVAEWNRSAELMDLFLKEQNYRLAFWRNSERELGYRRFFDINSLITLRVENEQVFRDTHDLILRWVDAGVVDGLRVDHVDGLRNPTAYLARLRQAAPRAWIVVEKILQSGEPLPEDWPIAGTTGYDFLNLVAGLFIHPDAAQSLTQFYADFTGERGDFTDIAYLGKKDLLSTSLGADLNRLTALLFKISGSRAATQDYTRHELHEALRETLAQFPVYRTYVVPGAQRVGEADAAFVADAVSAAQARCPELDHGLFSLIEDLLLSRHKGPRESEFVQRFQQISAPVMAKGVEDTAFYRYYRFIALNEVGGAPEHFGTSLDQFHEGCAVLQRERPETMLSTSTHDTKRSEDVRARLAVLSEIPSAWCAAVRQWSARHAQYKTDGLPEHNTEYLLYQTLVGAWPISVDRTADYILKAVREAKQSTSWSVPNTTYEDAVRHFVERVMADPGFLKDLEEFVEPLIVPGRINSLAQTLLKLTAPGVPDIYQGTELWDLSLVDPDNRRPVDYAERRRLLADSIEADTSLSAGVSDEGISKLHLIQRTLSARRRMPDAFGGNGAYRRLSVCGIKKDHVVAFLRGASCITVVPRWGLSVGDGWSDTSVEVPAGRWHNEFTGVVITGGQQLVRVLLSEFPVGLWVSVPSS